MTRAGRQLVISSVVPSITGIVSWWQRLLPCATPLPATLHYLPLQHGLDREPTGEVTEVAGVRVRCVAAYPGACHLTQVRGVAGTWMGG